ncbi:dethiobiotin synthetase [Actinoplanes tereljensis]
MTAPQQSPTSPDVTAVITRLPQANAVFTPGPAGFTLPPFPFPTATIDFTAAAAPPVAALTIPAARSDPDAFLDGPLGAPMDPPTDGPLGAPIDGPPGTSADDPFGAPIDRPFGTRVNPAALDAPVDGGSGVPTDGPFGAPGGDGSLEALADGWRSTLADRSLGATAPPVEPPPSPSTAPAPSPEDPGPAPSPAEPGTAPLGVQDGPGAEPLGVPISPAPVGPGLDGDDLPSGQAIGEEIADEPAAQTPEAQPAPRHADSGEWRGIVLVTGTDTDVGKTIVTAAVAAAAQASGLRVAVIKPGQTGIATGAPTDLDVINRLAAPETTRVLAEYPEPMAPLAAATVASMPPLELYEVVDAIRTEAEKHDLVLVEGAGGLLVPMGVRPSGASWTLADLATTLGVKTIVVARAGLGTLNHTALTLEALNRRGVPAGVVIGAWPADPELVHWANLSEMVPHLIGALPDGAGRMDPGVFRRSAPGWLTPPLYGEIDNWRVWAEETGEGHH